MASKHKHGGLIQLTQAVVKHFADHGALPTEDSGYSEVLGCTWATIAVAFWKGQRGAPQGTTLATWLAENFGDLVHSPRYIGEAALVEAVNRYREQNNGSFPTMYSGEIPELKANWNSIEHCLRDGNRGLPGGTTLSRWLDAKFGRRPKGAVITKEWLLSKIDAYRAANSGNFPLLDSAMPVDVGYQTTWADVNRRFAASGNSLARVIERYYRDETAVTEERLAVWVARYLELNKKLPYVTSEEIVPGGLQSWKIVSARFAKLPTIEPGTSMHQWMRVKFNVPEEPKTNVVKAPEKRPEPVAWLIRKDWLTAAVDAYRAENNGDFPPLDKPVRVPGTRLTWADVSAAVAPHRSLAHWLVALYPDDTAVTEARLAVWVERYRQQSGGRLPVSHSPERVPGGVLKWREVAYRFAKLDTGLPFSAWLNERFPAVEEGTDDAALEEPAAMAM